MQFSASSCRASMVYFQEYSERLESQCDCRLLSASSNPTEVILDSAYVGQWSFPSIAPGCFLPPPEICCLPVFLTQESMPAFPVSASSPLCIQVEDLFASSALAIISRHLGGTLTGCTLMLTFISPLISFLHLCDARTPRSVISLASFASFCSVSSP